MSRGGSGPRVVVVGGGIAGLSLLYELARLGIGATLVERGAIAAQGASSLPAALLNPHRGRTGRAKELDLAGLNAFWRLADDLEATGRTTGAHRSGVLRIASSARQAELWRTLAGPRWLEPSLVHPPFHAPHGAMLVPQGGWVAGPTLLRSLAEACRDLGAEVREGVRLSGATGRSGAMVAETDQGVLVADEVILCPGAYGGENRLPDFERAAGGAVSVRWSASAAGAAAMPSPPPLAGSACAVFLAGTVVITGSAAPARDGGQPVAGEGGGLTTREAERLRGAVAWFLPGIEEAPVIATWRGVRLRRASGNPVVRRLRSGLTLFGALGGRGFLCAPLLAGRLAQRIAAAYR